MLGRLFGRIQGHPPSHEKFAKLMERMIREAGYAGELSFNREKFAFTCGDGAYIFLANAYRDYVTAARSQRIRVLRRYASGVRDQSEHLSLGEARDRLRPVLRNLAMLLEAGVDFSQMREFGPDCVELVAIDSAEATTTLTGGIPEAWKIGFEEASSIARDNLRARTNDEWREIARGVMQGDWADAYDSSRALLSDLIARVPVRGRPVFMVPNRDTLLVTGDRDEAGLESMLKHARDLLENGGRWVSARMYVYDEDRNPVVYTMADEEGRECQKDLERLMDNDCYANQKQILEARYEREQRDVFVATHALMRRPESTHLVSFCTWTKDCDSLLPAADQVVLVELEQSQGENERVFVDWTTALRVVGHLLEREDGHLPPRFRTLGFPSDEELARLRSEKSSSEIHGGRKRA